MGVALAGAVQCAARKTADARPCPPLSARTCASISHSLCNSARSHRFTLQITWYEFKHKDVYERGDPNGQPVAASTLLWTGSPVEFSAVRPGTDAKGVWLVICNARQGGEVCQVEAGVAGVAGVRARLGAGCSINY